MRIGCLILFCYYLFAATAVAAQTAVAALPNNAQQVFSLIVRPEYSAELHQLNSNDQMLVNKLATLIEPNAVSVLKLTGHSSNTPIKKTSRQRFANNQQLARHRAQLVADYLLQIHPELKDKIVIESKGARQPIADNSTPLGRWMNKRIELQLTTAQAADFALLFEQHPDFFADPQQTLSKAFLQAASLKSATSPALVNMSLRNTSIVEAMEMLSKQNRVNILLSKEITGAISLNLYDVTVDDAIKSIARAAGYLAEEKDGTYFIITPTESGKFNRGNTQVKTFKVQYSDPRSVENIIKNHLSDFGKVTALPDRSLLVVEDTPEFIQSSSQIIREVDKQPLQVLIEAQILEVTLNDSESYGVDWRKLFNSDGGTGSYGFNGLASANSNGLVLELVTPNIEFALNMLSTEGRVKTLSTPKLLAVENQEAEVVIGERIGYKLTTTINQVTNESIAFLQSGVILKVKPLVDDLGRILLDIHPEVSNGTVSGGIPSQTTTEVTTQVLVDNGQTVFIGGLIKRNQTDNQDKVIGLGDLPLIGGLFKNSSKATLNTETVVILTPRIISDDNKNFSDPINQRINQFQQALGDQPELNGRQTYFTKDQQLWSDPNVTIW